MIRTVPKSMIDEIWPAVEPLLKAAIGHHPFLTVEDLHGLVRDVDGADLLVAIEDGRVLGAAAIEIQAFEHARTGHILACGGLDGFYERQLPAMTDALEAWALVRDCLAISMLGRPGWAKFVSRRGWQVMPTVAAWRMLRSEPHAAAGSSA